MNTQNMTTQNKFPKRDEVKKALSERASSFLAKAEFRKSITDEKEIKAAFVRQGIEATPELLRFQKEYGGLTHYVWKEPIVFGILHAENCRGQFRGKEGELLIIPADDEVSIDHYVCADTLYQKELTITADGNYYENYNLECLSFDTLIEDLSMYDYLNRQNGYNKIYTYEEPATYRFNLFLKEFHLTEIDGHWDEVLRWYRMGDASFVRKAYTGFCVFSKRTHTKNEIDLWESALNSRR